MAQNSGFNKEKLEMNRNHCYPVTVTWTGNTGHGTSDYRGYERKYEISSGAEKPIIPGSSDPVFRGDRTRWSPEELLVASLSACHKLWYLHLCAEAGVQVVAYVDQAEGSMQEGPDGSGYFDRVVLRPEVTINRAADLETAERLHEMAHRKCFIANSVNFPVEHEPKTRVLFTDQRRS
ncbi:MAG TPA: OsmC family protein [Bryobacteraceae bacterium]|nr:OsmC family protein [Bryobacteraceae bacterium]